MCYYIILWSIGSYLIRIRTITNNQPPFIRPISAFVLSKIPVPTFDHRSVKNQPVHIAQVRTFPSIPRSHRAIHTIVVRLRTTRQLNACPWNVLFRQSALSQDAPRSSRPTKREHNNYKMEKERRRNGKKTADTRFANSSFEPIGLPSKRATIFAVDRRVKYKRTISKERRRANRWISASIERPACIDNAEKLRKASCRLRSRWKSPGSPERNVISRRSPRKLQPVVLPRNVLFSFSYCSSRLSHEGRLQVGGRLFFDSCIFSVSWLLDRCPSWRGFVVLADDRLSVSWLLYVKGFYVEYFIRRMAFWANATGASGLGNSRTR